MPNSRKPSKKLKGTALAVLSRLAVWKRRWTIMWRMVSGVASQVVSAGRRSAAVAEPESEQLHAQALEIKRLQGLLDTTSDEFEDLLAAFERSGGMVVTFLVSDGTSFRCFFDSDLVAAAEAIVGLDADEEAWGALIRQAIFEVVERDSETLEEVVSSKETGKRRS